MGWNNKESALHSESIGLSKIFANDPGLHGCTPVRHRLRRLLCGVEPVLTMVRKHRHNGRIPALEGLGSKATWEENNTGLGALLAGGWGIFPVVSWFPCMLIGCRVTKGRWVWLTDFFLIEDRFSENENILKQ